jgi:parallel beta-helix repeat protein
MKWKTVGIVFILALSVFSLTITIVPENARAIIRYVGGVGTRNYTTIQSALDAANVDDTILVFSGTYVESIVVSKSLRLLGEHRNTTIIDGAGSSMVVLIETGMVTMSGFSVTNGSWGISLADSAYTTISNNNISGNDYGLGSGRSPYSTITDNIISKNDDGGVVVFDSQGNTISNNNISGNYGGVDIYDDDRSIVEGNNISNNAVFGVGFYNSIDSEVSNNYLLNNGPWGTYIASSSGIWVTDNYISNSTFGIWLEDSSWHEISGNSMERSSIFLSGNQIEHWNTHSISPSNTVDGRPVYYCRNANGGTIPFSAGQIILANCDGVTVENQNIINLYFGMQIGYSSSNIITNNTVLSSDRVGIYLQASSGNLIIGNNASNNGNGGIHVDASSTTNRIVNNTASRNGHGVFLDSPGNSLTGNTLYNNSNGVYLASSDNNRIVNNTIFSNLRGVVLRSSVGNRIFHNNFTGNGIQAEDDMSNSEWDNSYPSGGNFWSDYTGTDTKNGVNQDLPSSDGIGDIPYNITGGLNKDRYPLIDPLAALPMPPSEPQNLNATAGNQQISLSWSPPTLHGGSPIAGYYIYRGNTSGGESFLMEVGNVLTYIDGGLTNGQTYYYYVSAINIAGEGPNSTEANATPLIIPTVPSEPQKPLATAGNGLIDLTWNAPQFDGNSSITNYRVYRGTVPGGESFLVEIGNVTTHTDNGLTNGQIYYYKISAVNGIGEGPLSEETFATPTSVPGAPMILQASLTGYQSQNITITWSLSSDDGSGQNSVVRYEIYKNRTYDPNGLGYGAAGFIANGSSELTIKFVGEGDPDNYFYRICAVDLNGLMNCAKDQAAKFTRPLSKGPNLISIPLIQLDQSIQRVLQTLSYDNAWSYDPINQEWRSFSKSKPYGQSLEYLNHTMGIWVNVTQDSNLTVAGVVPTSTTIDLQAGWNLVGFPSFDDNYTVADLKAAVGVKRIEEFDGLAPPYFLRAMVDGDFLQAGFGYWIRVVSPAVWIVENV